MRLSWVGVEQASPPNFRLGEVERILTQIMSLYTPLESPGSWRLELFAHTNTKPILRFGQGVNPVDVALLSPLKPDTAKC